MGYIHTLLVSPTYHASHFAIEYQTEIQLIVSSLFCICRLSGSIPSKQNCVLYSGGEPELVCVCCTVQDSPLVLHRLSNGRGVE